MTTPASYTDDQRVEALTRLELNGGNISKTSRQLTIPRATIRFWRATCRPDIQSLPVATALQERGPELADRVAQEIEYIAFGNLSDVVQWTADGHLTLTASDDLTPAQAALISEIKVKRTRQVTGRGEDAETWIIEDVSIKTRDKLKALETRAKMKDLALIESTTVNNHNEQTNQFLILDGRGNSS